MSDTQPRLYLLSPVIGTGDAFLELLAEACRAGDIAAVLLRLAEGDERSLVKTVKVLAPAAQDAGAALLVETPGELDAALVAARGGADGVHTGKAAELKRLRERLREGRMLGAGQLRTKHDAMAAGEAGADYVMFGEPKADGYVPPLDQVAERAEWWAEIFETPCVAYAPSLEAVRELAGTGAEFIAIGDVVWSHPAGPAEAVRLAAATLSAGAREVAR
jgi:thiamine-phosphate pyrophosphorylase